MYNQIRTALEGVTLHQIHVRLITVMLEWWAIRHLYHLLFTSK
jgi:hypothetical protein